VVGEVAVALGQPATHSWVVMSASARVCEIRFRPLPDGYRTVTVLLPVALPCRRVRASVLPYGCLTVTVPLPVTSEPVRV